MTFTDSGSEVYKNPPFKMTNILCILFIINEQESRYSEPHVKGRMGKRTGVHLILCFIPFKHAALLGVLDRSSFMHADY